MKANSKAAPALLKFINSAWGNLETAQARAAWAKAQPARCRAEDAVFRKWLIDSNVPEDVAARAWATGSRAEAIAVLAENTGWIKYYKIEAEVRAAFKKHENG